MDYAKQLRRELHEAHSVFHEFALAISTASATTLFFFFEGEEDPAFYMPHIAPRLIDRQHHSLICFGRSEVLKAQELVERDGRGARQTLFFIDKDHTDHLDASGTKLPTTVYQTDTYSIENYLVCDHVFRRFWVERLHLTDLDQRYPASLQMLHQLSHTFQRKARALTALILIGRGLDGLTPCKLNLNNVQLDKMFSLDHQRGICRLKTGALNHFLTATDFKVDTSIRYLSLVKDIIRKRLCGSPKTYVRGKFELWFFWKFLVLMTRQLSDRDHARQTGLRRATPTFSMAPDSAVELLAPLTPCPASLDAFLRRTL